MKDRPPVPEVFAAFGGIRPLARLVGVRASTAQYWAEMERIPDWRWPQVIAAASVARIKLPKGKAA